MGNLTEVAVRTALKKRRPGVTQEVADGTVSGLCLRIGPNDATWSLRYRVTGEGGVSERGHKKTGKQHRISLGEYPVMSILAARALANRALTYAKSGVDPAIELEKNATAGSLTLRDLKEVFMAEYVHMKELRASRKYEMAFETHILPDYGEVLAELLTREQVRAMVKKAFVKRPRGSGPKERPKGGKEAARTALGALRKMIGWARQEQKIKRADNPCEGMENNLPKKKKREVVLTVEQARIVWRASYLIDYPFGPIYRLILLSSFRKGEWGDCRAEFLNLVAKLCVIPADEYKSDHVHVMPLVSQAVEILDDVLRNHCGSSGPYLFSGTDGEKPVSGWSRAHKRMLDAVVAINGQSFPFHWTRQDLRRTVATRVAEILGVGGERLIKRVLGHSQGDDVTEIYNRYGYVKEMRAALELWVAQLLSEEPPAQSNATKLAA